MASIDITKLIQAQAEAAVEQLEARTAAAAAQVRGQAKVQGQLLQLGQQATEVRRQEAQKAAQAKAQAEGQQGPVVDSVPLPQPGNAGNGLTGEINITPQGVQGGAAVQQGLRGGGQPGPGAVPETITTTQDTTQEQAVRVPFGIQRVPLRSRTTTTQPNALTAGQAAQLSLQQQQFAAREARFEREFQGQMAFNMIQQGVGANVAPQVAAAISAGRLDEASNLLGDFSNKQELLFESQMEESKLRRDKLRLEVALASRQVNQIRPSVLAGLRPPGSQPMNAEELSTRLNAARNEDGEIEDMAQFGILQVEALDQNLLLLTDDNDPGGTLSSRPYNDLQQAVYALTREELTEEDTLTKAQEDAFASIIEKNNDIVAIRKGGIGFGLAPQGEFGNIQANQPGINAIVQNARMRVMQDIKEQGLTFVEPTADDRGQAPASPLTARAAGRSVGDLAKRLITFFETTDARRRATAESLDRTASEFLSGLSGGETEVAPFQALEENRPAENLRQNMEQVQEIFRNFLNFTGE